MKFSNHYNTFVLALGLFLTLSVGVSLPSYCQNTSGKKLEVSEKSNPSKMDAGKVKTSRRIKAKGNPNRGSNKVKAINPFHWDWDKVMWLKARKSDYETKDYNPDKRPKRKQYSNDKQRYRSESRKPGESAVELEKPLVPYDARIDDKGPVLHKKIDHKKIDVNDKAGPQIFPHAIGLMDPRLTLERGRKEDKRSKTDGKKLYTRKVKDVEPDYDSKDLMIAVRRENKPQKMDNDKLETFSVTKRDKDPFDDDKLFTAKQPDKDRKPFKMDKLEVATISKPKKQDLTDDRLFITIPKVERSKLHDKRLLTVAQHEYPTKTMKRLSKDIAEHDGEYKKHVKVSSDSHPGTLQVAAKNYSVPVLGKTLQFFSTTWSSIFKNSFQPRIVKEKKPKERRDKGEGKIWDNSVHPDEWKVEQAESGN